MAKDISLIYTSFFNGWTSNFICGEYIEISSLVYKLMSFISSSVIDRIKSKELESQFLYDQKIRDLESRICRLEMHRVYSEESSE